MRQVLLISILLVAFYVKGQTYNFESTSTPSGWTVTNGTLAPSAEHHKGGLRSLCWTINAGTTSVVTVVWSPVYYANAYAAFMQIYSPDASNSQITVEFGYKGSNTNYYYSAIYTTNYKGWREFLRNYSETAGFVNHTINSVRFKLTSTTARKIYFDDINLKDTIVSTRKRIIGTQWINDSQYFTVGSVSKNPFNLYSNVVDIQITQPTATELDDLYSLRSTLARTPTAGNSTELTAARNYATSLNISRNGDGSVKGNLINTSAESLTTDFVKDIFTKAEILAADATDNTKLEFFRLYLDHILDQGIAEGCSFELFSNVYDPLITIPEKILNLLPKCTTEEKNEVLKLVKWIALYGHLYDSSLTYLSLLDSDIPYLCLPHMAGVAVFQTDDALAVRELKGLKRFIDRNLMYTPGGNDFLKQDGTSFHHNSHYNNYTYSLKTITDYMNILKGTVYKVSTNAYNRLKKAVVSEYKMATINTGDTRHTANSLCGRHPFDTGMEVQYTYALFNKLIAIGEDCLGVPDSDLIDAKAYFFQPYSTTPNVKYNGFHQFNNGALGIYRTANWVATMKAPTTKYWGSEIYSGANRFGRYQSHGSLEITYNGTLAKSGYPTNKTGGGWDWNVIPGTTTIHYTTWQDLMPGGNINDRFDQYAKTSNFAGALEYGDIGLFACNFDQADNWGSLQRFSPTNLKFKKSMFAIDNKIFCLGSDISSDRSFKTTLNTATNLFQNIYDSANSVTFYVNGVAKSNPYSTTLSSVSSNWMINIQKTGYYIPSGNDDIIVQYNNQTTPKEDGSDYATPTTTLPAAKAYIKHGTTVPVSAKKKYSFVVIPNTYVSAMQSFATACNNGSVYSILKQDADAHVIKYLPLEITAYSFFVASTVSTGIVAASSGPVLLIEKTLSGGSKHSFGISLPDMKPQWDATYGWIEGAESVTSITLNGNWYSDGTPTDGITINTPSGGKTIIQVSLGQGNRKYFAVKDSPAAAPSIHTQIAEDIQNNKFMTYYKEGSNLKIKFLSNSSSVVNITISSIDGRVVYNKKHSISNSEVLIPTRSFLSGIYYCIISDSQHSESFKWIK